MRSAVCVLAVLAGCGSDPNAPRLAEPTDQLESHVPPKVKIVPPNYADKGYVMNESWHVGDQWDYVSNLSSTRTMKIVDESNLPEGHAWHVLEVVATHGTTARALSWVLSSNYTRVSLSADNGITQSFSPYAPIRLTKNATYTYNLTTTRPPEPPSTKAIRVTLHYTGQEIRTLPWGNVQAARIEESDTSGRATSQVVRWVSREYANDVFLESNDEEYHLVASHVGDRFHGDLREV